MEVGMIIQVFMVHQLLLEITIIIQVYLRPYHLILGSLVFIVVPQHRCQPVPIAEAHNLL